MTHTDVKKMITFRQELPSYNPHSDYGSRDVSRDVIE